MEDDLESFDNIPTEKIEVPILINLNDASLVRSDNKNKYKADKFIDECINAGYPKSLIDMLNQFKAAELEYATLDKKLVDILRDLSDIEKTPLYENAEYSRVMQNIDASSYVISFKTAGLFKIYTPEMLSTLNMQANSQFKGVNEIYEVVNRDSRQKIIIIIDGSVENEVEKIKNYVIAFFEKQRDKLHKDDLISYKNPTTGNFEMMINRFVNNFTEKKEIVTKLVSFISEEEDRVGGTTNIEWKISCKTISNIPNADVFPIPSKRGMSINPKDWIPYHVQASPNATNVINIYNITGDNNTIGTIGNDNNVTTVEKNHTIKNKEPSKNDVQTFVDFIKNKRPSWYKEGEYIKINDLYRYFINVTKSNKSCSMFSKKFKGILFSKSILNTIDGVNARRVMLWDITDL